MIRQWRRAQRLGQSWLRVRKVAHLAPQAREVLTGERLQALCDVSLVPAGWPVPRPGSGGRRRGLLRTRADGSLSPDDLALAERATTIFVYGHEVDRFLAEVWPLLTSRKVIVSHNSDSEIGPRHVQWLDGEGRTAVRWFAQNATASHPRLTPVPIGIANAVWPHGDLRVLAAAADRARTSLRDRLVFARFDPETYPPRQAVWDALRPNFPELAAAPPRPLPFRSYLTELSRYRFAICPRGNGIDTYRVWECLYLGVIPVVERSAHTSHWVDQGLPLVLVDDWHDVTPEFLHASLDRARPVDWRALPPVLRLSTYAGMISAARAEATASRPDVDARR